MPKQPKQKTSPKVDGPKYPHVHVRLSGQDGNIFFIGGRVSGALRRAGVPQAEIDMFHADLSSAENYYAALGVVNSYVRTS